MITEEYYKSGVQAAIFDDVTLKLRTQCCKEAHHANSDKNVQHKEQVPSLEFIVHAADAWESEVREWRVVRNEVGESPGKTV